jgi:hypothetical protein
VRAPVSASATPGPGALTSTAGAGIADQWRPVPGRCVNSSDRAGCRVPGRRGMLLSVDRASGSWQPCGYAPSWPLSRLVVAAGAGNDVVPGRAAGPGACWC